jgi:nicotinamidase-related amidase
MSSQKIRDQKTDHLLTPENSAVIIIDYQPTQVGSIESMDKYTLVKNVVALIKLAKVFKMPIVVSTVNVKAAGLKSTIPQIAQEVKDLPSYDRTTINAWEDIEFLEAVKTIKRKKLIMAALWTEACLLFPTLDALKEGYEVYPVVDAVAGTSIVAHDAALRRMEKAGAQPVSLMGLICEIQRDWARGETVPAMLGVLAGVGNNVGLDIEGQGLERGK